MKSTLSLLTAVLFVALLVPSTLLAHCGHCGSDAKHDEAAHAAEAKAEDSGASTPATTATTATEAKYACPMHPEVTSDTASDCPKCGMKLEPAGAKDGSESGEAAPTAAGSGSDK
jgi:hypothetical protein